MSEGLDNKYEIETIEDQKTSHASNGELETILDPRSREEAERALVRKLDLTLMPILGLIYIMNYIGRNLLDRKSGLF